MGTIVTNKHQGMRTVLSRDAVMKKLSSWPQHASQMIRACDLDEPEAW